MYYGYNVIAFPSANSRYYTMLHDWIAFDLAFEFIVVALV
jgi:hypothetical protein